MALKRPVSTAKFCISLSDSLVRFVESYRKKCGLKCRSQVIEEAVALLRSQELEAAYREASTSYDEVWETTTGDGL